MRVLVSVASRHGGTREIGEALAEVLVTAGHVVELVDPDDVDDVDGFDAVILGSSVYAGRWSPTARALVDRHAEALRRRAVWMFSSGPVGDPPRPEGRPVEVVDLVERLHPRDHRVFAGRLDPAQLSLGERAMQAIVRAPSGDFRDFDEVRAWAAGIAESLGAGSVGR